SKILSNSQNYKNGSAWLSRSQKFGGCNMQGLKNAALFRESCIINGKWLNAESGKTIEMRNPAYGMLVGHVPNCGQAETRVAIEAAWNAWQLWRAFTAKQRSDILWHWAHLIDENKEDLARIMTIEEGKPLEESRGEIDYANGFVKWFA